MISIMRYSYIITFMTCFYVININDNFPVRSTNSRFSFVLHLIAVTFQKLFGPWRTKSGNSPLINEALDGQRNDLHFGETRRNLRNWSADGTVGAY